MLTTDLLCWRWATLDPFTRTWVLDLYQCMVSIFLSLLCPCCHWLNLQAGVVGGFLQNVACMYCLFMFKKMFRLSQMQPFAVK